MTRRDLSTHAWKVRRKRVLDAHRAEHGDWCPGWQREPHEDSDLTVDHLIPVGLGGSPGGPVQVLCRSCNSRRGKAEDLRGIHPRSREW